MWIYNSDFGKWSYSDDTLGKESFDLLKQELSATRFYSRVLSGATFLPINNLDNIYDILGEWKPKSWYISNVGSIYSDTSVPPKFAKAIDKSSSYEFYNKFIAEYGLTLKNLFTPDRIIKDSVKNYYHVDISTTSQIDLAAPITEIDGLLLKKGHKILVKDQKNVEALMTSVNPDDYFLGPYNKLINIGLTTTYEVFTKENGIYEYDGRKLVRSNFLDDYSNCVRYSVYVKMGSNAGKQYHLKRLINGYYPTTKNSEPIAFEEKHNWLLRNRVDYNNLFEINYYDILKHNEQSYYVDGVTYSIPERVISVGEFGVILNTQNLINREGISTIVPNKYKVNLRSISQTTMYYWIVGEDSTILKVRKHDFLIEKVLVDTLSNLTSVSFFNDLRGVAVGEFNTILITTDGGSKWDRLRIADFAPYTYNKVIFDSVDRFYIGGRNGVFLELYEDKNGWTALKRRIFEEIDDDDEYLLADGINDIYKANLNNWNLGYTFDNTQTTGTNKEILFLACSNGKLIAYDKKDSTDFDFLYLDFGKNYGDIRNITRRGDSDEFYFTADSGLYTFDINSFSTIGVGNTYSNTILGTTATLISDLYANEIFDYFGNELLICGNTSLLRSTLYDTISFKILDSEFESRLKPKLLFMDYDIGAKLNWFTDSGEYRLPSIATFSATSAFKEDGTINNKRLNSIGFSPIVYGPTAPSMATQSESTWYNYWFDSIKTFEYYSKYPLNDIEVTGYTSSLVLISNTFSYIGGTSLMKGPDNKITIQSTSISKSYESIINLAPSFAYSGTQSSRYDQLDRPDILEFPVVPLGTDPVLFLYDYLMILRIPKNNKFYQGKVGDVYRIESESVSSNFTVNKIWSSTNHFYMYMYSEFNQSIINQISEASVTIWNLNVYSDIEEFVSNFELHPMGLAYSIDMYAKDDSSKDYLLKIDSKFNSITSYYNLATDVNLYYLENGTTSSDKVQMSYTSGFLKFGYTPTYNLLDYMESINKYPQIAPVFYAAKEYFVLPHYLDIPMGSLSSQNIYVDSNGITQSSTTGNKIMMGEGLKLEWESIMHNTFVDITINQPSSDRSFDSKRMLVMNKYKIENVDGLGISAYVIEFHKGINFELGTNFEGATMDIKSRRTLQEISDDLQELNNIHRAKLNERRIVNDSFGFRNYQRELNFKIPTDSYAKVFLSDSDTVDALTAILYVDYKYELAMNITKLDTEFNVPIKDTIDYNGNLFISCEQKHGLNRGDAVVLEFNGGEESSEYLNQQYFGYRVVTEVYGEYDFTVDLPYGTDVYVGKDSGFVKYVRRDPFLNYQPIDLIDIGLDKKGKVAIELNPENIYLKDKIFSLKNVDFSKYRYRMVDGLNIETISVTYPWILEAEISGAVLGLDSTNNLVWYKGTWHGGRWFGGTWISGTWKYGDWYDGVWNSKTIKDKGLKVEIDQKSSDPFQSTWFTGRWFGGTWNNGTWVNGRFYDGIWNDGVWNNGIWNDGTWNNGRFIGGIWVYGKWKNGLFNTDNEFAYWIDGEWSGGDFENGMWYNGSFESKDAPARFGTKAYNSRTATWHGGKWLSGSFYSRMNQPGEVSDIHKYSIWRTGQWVSGDFYGGIAYNIDFKSGTWHGGILEDIQIIGMDENNNSFILNGIFKFNIGDNFYVIDNGNTSVLSSYGSNDNPTKYLVLKVVEDDVNKLTEVYVATNVSDFDGDITSHKVNSTDLNINILPNTALTNSLLVQNTQKNIKDFKVKLYLESENKIPQRNVPILQYKISNNGGTWPIGTLASVAITGEAEPLDTKQSDFLSQNIIGVRRSNATGAATFHWEKNFNGYN
jgi:hypothetical protein